MNSIRQEQIREYIEKNNVVTIKELQSLFPEVSLMTIHRDLDALEQAGDVVKVRGGARSVRHTGDLGFDVRLRENNAGKHAVAGKALSLIQPNSSVFFDASTTNLILARCLPDIELNIFTTGPNIAIELCRLHNANITLCCGTMNRKNMALSGQNTLEMLDKINIDLALIGVSGCSSDAGFTCGTESDMVVKRKVIQKARTSVVMCDQAKFSRLMPYTFATFADVDYLICDGQVPENILQTATAAGVKIL
ncbi:MAG: DeoR/GlpR transcriptional regulator [Oscillospiraceae bacterium]|nr:DeoR/GlpR transcriptional regulator [Oscillospiraceae bacterium]